MKTESTNSEILFARTLEILQTIKDGQEHGMTKVATTLLVDAAIITLDLATEQTRMSEPQKCFTDAP